MLQEMQKVLVNYKPLFYSFTKVKRLNNQFPKQGESIKYTTTPVTETYNHNGNVHLAHFLCLEN